MAYPHREELIKAADRNHVSNIKERLDCLMRTILLSKIRAGGAIKLQTSQRGVR
jgi:hypothetical protein